MVDRIRRSVDFERVLAVPPKARSAHFAVHHLAARPSQPGQTRDELRSGRVDEKLSTGKSSTQETPVDQSRSSAPAGPVQGIWLGTVVPKRNARRSVTRSLFKRLMRAALARRAAEIAPGLWVLRLRSSFDTAAYSSASSDGLREAARSELDALVSRLCRGAAA